MNLWNLLLFLATFLGQPHFELLKAGKMLVHIQRELIPVIPERKAESQYLWT